MVLLTALVVGILPGGWAIAQEKVDRGELSSALEAAGLSSEGQALLREKAGDAVRAGVPERELSAIIQRGVGRGVPAPELARLLDVAAEAKRQELPIAPILDKLKEGLAKGAAPERIAAVASRMAGDLATSRDLIRRAEREGVRAAAEEDRKRAIEAVADALGRGVSRQEVEELSRRVAGSSRRDATMSRLETGAQATADLVSMGLPPRDASETVGVALSRGLGRHDLERLREDLARERRRGGSLEKGAERIREDIQSGRRERGRDQDRDRDRGGGRDDRNGRDGREERGGEHSGRH